jgi:hypothetical protein
MSSIAGRRVCYYIIITANYLWVHSNTVEGISPRERETQKMIICYQL